MKEGILQMEDASIEMILKVNSNKDFNIENYFNVSLKRVNLNIINAFSKIFTIDEKKYKLAKKQQDAGKFQTIFEFTNKFAFILDKFLVYFVANESHI